MNKSRIALAAAVGVACALSAKAQTPLGPFPGFGGNPAGPALIIQEDPNGAFSVVAGPSVGHPYDGVEDTYIGVQNLGPNPITALSLSSALPIFGFDGDGIDTFGSPGNGHDGTGYGGPDAFFNVNTLFSGSVDFVNPILPGEQTYFSLEEPVPLVNNGGGGGLNVPDGGSTMALLGISLAGLSAVRRRFKI